MRISRMKVGEWGKVRAFFDVEVEGITINGFKLINGVNGLFLGISLFHLPQFISDLKDLGAFNLPVGIFFTAGIGQSMCVIMISTMILSLTPPNLRGRIMGLRQLAVGGLPLGLLLSGAITELAGVQTALIFNGIIGSLLTIGVCLIWPQMVRSKSKKS